MKVETHIFTFTGHCAACREQVIEKMSHAKGLSELEMRAPAMVVPA